MKANGYSALAVTTLLLAAALIAAPVHAAVTPAQKCTVAKQKAAAKKADAKIKCHIKVKLAAAPDAACLQKAEDNFTKSFAKAEKPGACQMPGNAASVEGQVDTFVTALVQALNPGQALQARATTTPAQKCAIAKAKAASKKAVAKLKCHQKNLSTPSVSLLTFCLGQAEDKFDTAFTNAEKPSACATTGDAAAIESLVDVFVSGIVLGPPTPTPTPTPTLKPGQSPPTPTPCTSGFVDNGNGTITDCSTKLMWEKQDDSGGFHDWDYRYVWAGTCSFSDGLQPCQRNAVAEAACNNGAIVGVQGCAQCFVGVCSNYAAGTIWDFLTTLNGVNEHLAGYTDWRIPTLAELQTIVAPCPGGGLPCVPLAFRSPCTAGCTVTTCSCTQAGGYWSATTDAGNPYTASFVNFDNGLVGSANKTGSGYVRAVRGGL